jgi:NAD(P)-dependent dehydrogenase (short-subunit alcohol dehydrogenase family)
MAQSEEITRVVLFLRYDRAGYVTGQNIKVDGGGLSSTLLASPSPQ